MLPAAPHNPALRTRVEPVNEILATVCCHDLRRLGRPSVTMLRSPRNAASHRPVRPEPTPNRGWVIQLADHGLCFPPRAPGHLRVIIAVGNFRA